MAIDKNKILAEEIVKLVGGDNNISYVTHCITRLRFNLKDNSLPDVEKLEKTPGVIGVNVASGQFQVIIGQTVDKVYKYLPMADKEEISTESSKEKLTIGRFFSNILDALSGCLTPTIPILIATAMFKVFTTILGPSMLGLLTETSDLYRIFTIVGDAGFYFFPIYLGYTSARKFNASIVISMFLGGIMLHPLMNEMAQIGDSLSIYGLPFQPQSYASTVLPIILSVWVMSYIEKFLRDKTPSTLQTIIVPTLLILIMLPLTLTVFGPAGNFIGDFVVNGILSFGNLGGIWFIIAVGLVGAFWQFLVLTGMHLIMITAMILLMSTEGSDAFINVGATAASFATSGVALGAALYLKDKEQKRLSLSYIFSGLVGGVTEPALYGVAIRYKKPFIGLLAGGFFGGVYGAIVGLTSYNLVPVANVLALTSFVGGSTWNTLNGIIMGIISFTISAIVTYLVGFEYEKGEALNEVID